MTCDTTGLGIVNLHSGFRTDLRFLDVVEVDIMARRVDERPDRELIRDLPVEPLALI